MALVTLQVLEGLERGRVYEGLAAPVTIGREEDNAIRLNDERVSRFHAKIQADAERLILTDLESTNGIRVNGHPVRMRVLRPGDRITIGRSILLFGSREEIDDWTARASHRESGHPTSSNPSRTEALEPPRERDTPPPHAPALIDEVLELFPDGIPEIPRGLRGAQRAELGDLLLFIHSRLGKLLATSSVEVDSPNDSEPPSEMRIDWDRWQQLQALEMDLAILLRRLADPDD